MSGDSLKADLEQIEGAFNFHGQLPAPSIHEALGLTEAVQ